MQNRRPWLIAIFILLLLASASLLLFLKAPNQKPIVQVPAPIDADHVFELEPTDGSVVEGRETWVRWHVPGPMKGQVLWRKLGDASFRPVDAGTGERLLGQLSDLVPDASYEYYVEATADNRTVRSAVNRFSVKDDVSFEPLSEQTVQRDYDQTVLLTLRNNSREKITVAARALAHFDDLPADVVGPGSVDEPAELAAGQSMKLRLAVTAPDATREVYRIPIASANASILVTVRIARPAFQLSFRVVATDPRTLAQTIEVRNEGESLSDLAVSVVAPNDREVRLDGGFQHARLPARQTLQCVAVPILYLEFTALKAELEFRAADQHVRFPLEFKAPEGKRLIGFRTGSGHNHHWPDWYCTNRPSTTSSVPGPPTHGPRPRTKPPKPPPKDPPQPPPDHRTDCEKEADRLRKEYARYQKELKARWNRNEMTWEQYVRMKESIEDDLNLLRMEWQILQEECHVSGNIDDVPAVGRLPGDQPGTAEEESEADVPLLFAPPLRPGLLASLQYRAAFSRQHRGPFAAPAEGNAVDSSDVAAGWHGGTRVCFAWHRADQITCALFDPTGKVLQAPQVIGRGRWPRVVAEGKQTAVAFRRAEGFGVRLHDGTQWGDEIALSGQEAALAFARNGTLFAATSTGLWKLRETQFERVTEAKYVQPALLVDRADKPHVAWNKDGQITYDGMTVGMGERPSLWSGSEGVVHLAYLEGGKLQATSRKGDTWSKPEPVPIQKPAWPTLAQSGDGEGAGVRLTCLGTAEKGPDALWLVTLPAKEAILVPSLAGNVTDASLLVRFGLRTHRWHYRPHDVKLSVNDVRVGTLTKTIPDGRFLFPIHPYQLHASPGQPQTNRVALRSWHSNGGHYLTNNEFQMIVRTDWSEWFVFAADAADARQATNGPGVNHDKPDLVVLANSLKLPNAPPKDGRTEFVVTVANVGEANSLPARLVAQYQKTVLAEAVIPALAPGKQETVTMLLEGKVPTITFQLEQEKPDFDPKNDELTLRLWSDDDSSLTKDPHVNVIKSPLVDLDLRRWKQQGPKANGEWVVSPDGRSVVQKSNGDPTFYISPDNYRNATIKGKLKVTGNDDDYVGFVVGYRGPFAEKGDKDNQFEFVLFDWKQADQLPARVGFSLVRVKGNFDEKVDGEYAGFWDHKNIPKFEVLQTNFGKGKGWKSNTEHEVELRCEDRRILIRVDGKTVIDFKLKPDEPAFPAGRCGFYNFSQPDVRYSGFSAEVTGPVSGQPR